ncbi:NAD(P)-binding protein [Cadophora sp. DSE1049]|nr:NAD(P)-binding protein [Cadophora sp. DSE1049]
MPIITEFPISSYLQPLLKSKFNMASTQTPIVLITGANRGIGFSTVQALSLRYPTGTYIIGSRTLSSGEEAIQELRKLGIKANLEVVEIDVTKDSTIDAAVSWIGEKFGRLDVLVNNAGIALFPPSSSPKDIRENFNTTFNTNITSLYTVTLAFVPLLHLSPTPKVINISSGRASLTRSSDGKLPPTKKVEDALFEESRGDGKEAGRGKVEFFAANPGHCKTAFNGFKGTKDPLDGAEVVVRLVGGEGTKGGFWEFEEGVLREVLW